MKDLKERIGRKKISLDKMWAGLNQTQPFHANLLSQVNLVPINKNHVKGEPGPTSISMYYFFKIVYSYLNSLSLSFPPFFSTNYTLYLPKFSFFLFIYNAIPFFPFAHFHIYLYSFIWNLYKIESLNFAQNDYALFSI
jgi:hypothetical protein